MEMEENFSETNTEIILRDRNAFKEIYTYLYLQTEF
jgi:hypothetical protein